MDTSEVRQRKNFSKQYIAVYFPEPIVLESYRAAARDRGVSLNTLIQTVLVSAAPKLFSSGGLVQVEIFLPRMKEAGKK